jgi:hypothetical protein
MSSIHTVRARYIKTAMVNGKAWDLKPFASVNAIIKKK